LPLKSKTIILFIPIIISLAACFLFWRINSAIFIAQADENLAQSFQEDKGRVLAAVENAGVLPEQTYAAIYPEFNLPENEYRIITPTRRSNPAGLEIFASSSAAIDRDSNKVLWNKNSGSIRPIASITKLMTALVFLHTVPDWEKIYELQPEDVRVGGKSYIYPGDQVKVEDLFYLTLVGSDNTAAVALVKSTGLTEAEFVAKMNRQAVDFGLASTKFEDISGLSNGNVSTAKEVLILAKKCLANKKIRDTSIEENYEFSTVGGRDVKVKSTDQLLSFFPIDGINIMGGKTGHTDEAGYCFVGEFVDSAGHKIISVVLGADSDISRFAETKKLVKWAYDNFIWQ
jgi:D-alanyl-D-alanine carboxypeptidase